MLAWLLEVFGSLVDAIIGPSVTTTHEARPRYARFELRPDNHDPELPVGVASYQRVYKTTFPRWGLNITRSVFEVQGFAPDEIKHKFDPRLFERVCYPTLCLRMLKWTQYPHVYAIRAYIERVLPDQVHNSIKVTSS